MLSKKQVVSGIIIWALVYTVFVLIAGPRDFIDHLDKITPHDLALILTAVGVGVVAMGSCLYVISRNIGLGFGLVETIFLNTSVSLAHNLTPFGQAGGAPIGAAILSQRSNGRYEECLAAISVKDMVSFVPAIFVFVIGGAYIVVFDHSIPNVIRPMIGAFTGAVFIITLIFVALYRYPEFMRGLLERLVASVNRLLGRLPLLPSVDEEDVEESLTNFADSIAKIGSDRKTVVLASLLATTSFVAQGTLLWLALTALGVEIPVVLAIFIVQVSLLASGLPLPGGSGGVEGVQILIIIAMAGATRAPTVAAVVLSRGLVFWTPIIIGSLTLLAFQFEKRVK